MEVVTHEELETGLQRVLDAISDIRREVGGREPSPVYFNRREAAEYLRMSVAKLDLVAAAGDVKRAKLGEGDRAQVLYRKCDLDLYVESCLEMDAKEAATKARKGR